MGIYVFACQTGCAESEHIAETKIKQSIKTEIEVCECHRSQTTVIGRNKTATHCKGIVVQSNNDNDQFIKILFERKRRRRKTS